MPALQSEGNKMKLKTKLLTLSTLALSCMAHSGQVALTLDITGQGQVSIEGTDLSCSETCQLMVEENTPLTLKYLSDANTAFSQWGSQSCDSGQGVFIADELNKFSHASSFPKTMAMADFNGDGVDDAALLTLFPSTFKTTFNEGAGQFSSPTTVEKLSYASAMDTIDWDNDNDIDIVVVDYGSSTIKLYLNDGNGNFTFEADLNVPDVHSYAIAIADINDDNLPDILVSSFKADIRADNLQGLINSISTTDLSWYKNDGDFQFSHLETVSTDQGIFTLDLADADNDGDLDIAAAATTSNQTLLYINNQGSYQQSTIDTGKASYSVVFKDIDKSGLPDIASVAYYAKTLQLSMQQADGKFSAATTLSSFSEGPTALAVSDVDDDGRLDITTGVFNEKAFYWQRNLSYQDCDVTLSAKRTVEATFIQTSSQQEAKSSSSDSSSGGSTGFFVGLLMLITLSKRRLFIK